MYSQSGLDHRVNTDASAPMDEAKHVQLREILRFRNLLSMISKAEDESERCARRR